MVYCLARYYTAVLLSSGLAIIYGLMVNYHITVLTMINRSAIRNEEGADIRIINSKNGLFSWSSTMQGLQISAYFWGYLLGQLQGGRESEIYSPKWTMFFGVSLNVIFTLLTPMMSNIHAGAVVVGRVIEGIGGGVCFPATHILLERWSPPEERGLMDMITHAGTAAGITIFTLASGIIAATIGWKRVFYIEGLLSIIWLIIWMFFITDFPEEQTFMSDKERVFIIDSINEEEVNSGKSYLKVPWKDIFTSLPFWSIVIAHACSNWGWYLILTELPTYMKDVLNLDIKMNSFLSAIPYLSMLTFSIVLGGLIDLFLLIGIFTTTFGRKLATFFASFIPCICFALLCFITEPVYAVILMTISITCIGGMYSGFLSNHKDLSPNFAGTLLMITNTIASVPGIAVPLLVGWLNDQYPSIQLWRIVFCLTSLLYVVEFTVYLVFGSGNEQSWNKPSN
ncbi:hypothetical protein WA026_000450 [Henosepilachna vigintioctopunctata]|uniref:Major facilitator superfamily (MFS) profile domain-containing protein n=1 Tax=Henosepilachna vigintioctopunctata TaxID=420089 RepID=A0AAW1V7N2_9CUCU